MLLFGARRGPAMWRNYIICVLIGLLLALATSSLYLLRQSTSALSEADRQRQRAVAAESTRTALQQQVEQFKTPAAVPAPLAAATPASSIPAALQQIQTQVAALRGLQPRSDVVVRFLDQSAMQRFYLDRFNQDYPANQREKDQKLLVTLGLINPSESFVQLELDVLQEQILGFYNQDDKSMYLVADSGQFGPNEKITFAQEFDHALQDQYFDLTTLAPKHPDNDDRSLAVQALTAGDATLIQRLWAQQNLTPDELNRLSQSSGASKLLSAPLFLREQLLFPYADGFTFVRQIYQTGGYSAVDEVYRNPPRSTAQVLHIDKYRAHVAPVVVSLPDLAHDSLGEGWQTIDSNVFGELDLRLILSQLTDTAEGVRGASGWAGDRWQLLEKDGRQAVVVKSVWESDNAARNFFDAFSQAMKNRFFGARGEEASPGRQALTATNAATDVRRNGATVIAVISFDRASADAIADAAATP